MSEYKRDDATAYQSYVPYRGGRGRGREEHEHSGSYGGRGRGRGREEHEHHRGGEGGRGHHSGDRGRGRGSGSYRGGGGGYADPHHVPSSHGAAAASASQGAAGEDPERRLPRFLLDAPSPLSPALLCEWLSLRGRVDDYSFLLDRPARQLVISVQSDAISAQLLELEKSCPWLRVQLGVSVPTLIAHVFIDQSNIFIGAQQLPQGAGAGRAGGGGGYGEDMDHTVRVSIEPLVHLLEAGRVVRDRYVMGPSSVFFDHQGVTNSMWHAYEAVNYNVISAELGRSGRESSHDDMLHARILSVVATQQNADWMKRASTSPSRSPPRPPSGGGVVGGEGGAGRGGGGGGEQHILVLATGDGNENHGRTSFRQCVELALNSGWHVELWSWTSTVSKVYKTSELAANPRFRIRSLDPFKAWITFRRPPRFPRQHQQHQQEEDQNQGENAKERGDEGLCCICWDLPADSIIMPCMHMCLCQTCSTHDMPNNICPKCRAPITTIRRVYR